MSMALALRYKFSFSDSVVHTVRVLVKVQIPGDGELGLVGNMLAVPV